MPPAPLSIVEAPIHRTQDTAQDVDFVARQIRAEVQAPQALHDLPGFLRVEKSATLKILLEVCKKRFDFSAIGAWFRDLALCFCLARLLSGEDRITKDLDRRGDIERAEIRIGRDHDHAVAQLQLFVAEPGVFRSEHQCRTRGRRLVLKPGRNSSRIGFGPAQRAPARRRRDNGFTVGHRIGESFVKLAVVENMIGTRCACISYLVDIATRINQREPTERHGVHGSRRGANIAGMGGPDHNDFNVLRIHLGLSPVSQCGWFQRFLCVWLRGRFIWSRNWYQRFPFVRLRAVFTIRTPPMQAMLNIAIRAARQAGDFILRKVNKLPDLQVEVKARNDYVSEVDRGAEARIIDTLLKAYPQHGILAEEGGTQEGDGEFRWIIDPLDGTTNFLHGFPHYAVSIACEQHGRLIHGVVYDPIKQELFTASRGDGATLNNRKIRVGKAKSLQSTLLATGFPFRNRDQLESFQRLFGAFYDDVSDIRRAGSAALDLCYVAAGRLDGYWESGLSAWDLAAGALIVREAGGLVTDYSGDENFLEKGEVVAANPKVIAEMLRLIHRNRG